MIQYSIYEKSVGYSIHGCISECKYYIIKKMTNRLLLIFLKLKFVSITMDWMSFTDTCNQYIRHTGLSNEVLVNTFLKWLNMSSDSSKFVKFFFFTDLYMDSVCNSCQELHWNLISHPLLYYMSPKHKQ